MIAQPSPANKLSREPGRGEPGSLSAEWKQAVVVTTISAIGHAKRAAQAIDHFLHS